MKCANCTNDAAYYYDASETLAIPYCLACLPGFLRPQLKAGYLRKTEGAKKTLDDALDALPKSEPELEENRAIHGSTMKETAPELVEESKPVKKAAKKASAVEPDAE